MSTTQPLTDTQKAALRDLLEDVTISIHPDDKPVAVEFKDSVLGNAPAERRVNVNPRPGRELGVDLTEAQEKDVILFILAHEIMHTIHSDLHSKQRFTEEYPSFSKTAGRLRNLTEDLYVNREATEEKPGVRVGYAIYSECFMQGHNPITEYPDAHAYVKATEQLGIGGTVHSLKDADTDLQEYVARADEILQECEHEDDAARRDELTHDLIDLLQEYVDLENTAPPELPPLIGAGGDETHDMPDTGEPQPAPQPPEDADSENAADADASDASASEPVPDPDADPDEGDETDADEAATADTAPQDDSVEPDNADDPDEADESGANTERGDTAPDADPDADPTRRGQQTPDETPTDETDPTSDDSANDGDGDGDGDTDEGKADDTESTTERGGAGESRDPDADDDIDPDTDTMGGGAGDDPDDAIDDTGDMGAGGADADSPDSADETDDGMDAGADTSPSNDGAEAGNDGTEPNPSDEAGGEHDADDSGAETATETADDDADGADESGIETDDSPDNAGDAGDVSDGDTTDDTTNGTADTPDAEADPGSDATDEGSETGSNHDGDGTGSDDGQDGPEPDDTPDDGLDDMSDEHADALREMMEADEQNSTGRRADVDDKQEYQDGSEFGDRVSARVNAAENAPTTDIDERKAERDERIATAHVSETARDVRREYKMQRLADDFEDAFRPFKFGKDEVKRHDFGESINVEGAIRRQCGDFTAPQYKETQPSELGDRLLVVVADASSSMDELQLKLALMGLANAAEQIRDKIAIVAYSKNYDDYTQLVTAPHEEFRDEHLDSFSTTGRTPTPYGIRDGRSLANKITHREPVIIVVTDGKANEPISNEWEKTGDLQKADLARRESAEQVTAATQEGYPVIGVAVGDSVNDQYMASIFDDYVHTDMHGLADKLAEIYEDQLRETNAQYATTY